MGNEFGIKSQRPVDCSIGRKRKEPDFHFKSGSFIYLLKCTIQL